MDGSITERAQCWSEATDLAEARAAHPSVAVAARTRVRPVIPVVIIAGLGLAGGLSTGSLVLLGSSITNLVTLGEGVVQSLALAFARPASDQRFRLTFYRRALVAVVSTAAGTLILVCYVLLVAYRRILQPVPIGARAMLTFASIGLTIDLGARVAASTRTGAITTTLRQEMRRLIPEWSAVCVFITAAAVALTRTFTIDSAVAFAFGVVGVFRTWSLMRDTANVLVEAAPADVDVLRVYRAIKDAPGVRDIHDFRLWTQGRGLNGVSVHVVSEAEKVGDVLSQVHRSLGYDLNVQHATVQVEPEGWREPRRPE